MKWPSGIGKSIMLAAAVIIIIWLLLDKIHCNKASPISEKVQKDAIVRAVDSAQVHWQRREDSLKQATYFINRKIDSLWIVKARSDSRLQVYIDKSAELAAEVIRARIAGNNSEALEKCDSLADLNTGLRLSFGYQRWITDSLLQVNKELQSMTDSRLQAALDFNHQMRQGMDSVSTLYDNLYKRYERSARKLSKHYTLSLSIGYGVGTRAEPQPFVGITFGRTLIRF